MSMVSKTLLRELLMRAGGQSLVDDWLIEAYWLLVSDNLTATAAVVDLTHTVTLIVNGSSTLVEQLDDIFKVLSDSTDEPDRVWALRAIRSPLRGDNDKGVE